MVSSVVKLVKSVLGLERRVWMSLKGVDAGRVCQRSFVRDGLWLIAWVRRLNRARVLRGTSSWSSVREVISVDKTFSSFRSS